MVKIAVNGAAGRMGSRILELARETSGVTAAGAFDQSRFPRVSAGALKACDVLIDFSSPEGTAESLAACLEAGRALVVGTTGLDDAMAGRLRAAAAKIPLVQSSNMSIGVNVVLRLLEVAAKQLGNDFKLELTETHHVHKKDAPSGTAKMMAEVIKKQTGQYPPIQSIREGEIVGDHTARFEGAAESVEITHHAKSRDVFAKGAIEAARFLSTARPGRLYSMADVLGL
ncbi:MAG: 4-hydroxy-tetrahydrodipicolinate reductase [Omnitrophica bacterium RIFCSPHIGHO2_02_FULL_63_14]|nr:MAG: 4-hydroxy-tetrahydrodipicolinate reductase [Omnitrophica bacterium RIFCSPHIGHO2_02_FULL_63_14]